MRSGFAGMVRLGVALLVTVSVVVAEERLKITAETDRVRIMTEDGQFDITRHKNDVQLIGGVLQPMVPVPGVTPVGELEVLEALKLQDKKVVDMRTIEWRIESTIPGSYHMPYTEVAQRLDEFGCQGSQGDWDCRDAEPIIAFCNGPACPQSPIAIRAMVREGYPVNQIYYYRGGMQSWIVLGLSVLEDAF